MSELPLYASRAALAFTASASSAVAFGSAAPRDPKRSMVFIQNQFQCPPMLGGS